MSGVLLSVVILGSYFVFRGGDIVETKYVLAAIEKGTIISSITGSGQVSTSSQVDVKPKVSGEIVYLPVVKGQQVKTGQLLAQIDARDAQQAVRDAQINLESAQLSLSKLKLNQQSGASDLDQSIKDAQLALDQAYQNGFNAVSTTFLDIPSILAGMGDVFLENNLQLGNSNINAYGNMVSNDEKFEVRKMVDDIVIEYNSVDDRYKTNLDHYKASTRSSDPAVIEALLKETLATVKAMDDLVKHEQNMLDTVVLDLRTTGSQPVPSIISGYQSDIGQYLNILNGSVTNLTNISNSFDSKRLAIAKAEQSLNITGQSNPLDIATQENVVKQRQAALANSQNNLADYYVRTPFAGKLAAMDVKKGDSVSGSTIVATLISPQDIAEISLNEVEISNIKLGQKATLTFDAAEGLSITGTIIDIDDLGTVSQGVVTYKVKIGFDTQDSRIRPGMSVSAAIITDSKQDVLLVPNSAVKVSGGSRYVEIPGDSAAASQLMANAANAAGVALGSTPQQQSIEVGLTNDSVSEVTNGLKEGDIVVVRTVSASKTTTSTTQNNSLFPGTGSGGNRTFQTQVR